MGQVWTRPGFVDACVCGRQRGDAERRADGPAAPVRADAVLARFSDLLTRWNGPIVIVLGLLFGTWFLLKALNGLGVL
jgi:hypothetical protein